MAHERIRKFNTSETYPEQNLDNDLCQAVVPRGGLGDPGGRHGLGGGGVRRPASFV